MKTHLIITLVILVAGFELHAQNIGIGTSTPDPSARLEITSDSSGVLIPRLTDAQRDAIMDPATGLLVFVSTDSAFYYYDGSAWSSMDDRTRMLVDTDGDTKIQVEESADEDIIRFDLAGTEFFRMDNGRLEVLNTGNSVFIGEGAGASDDLTNISVFIGYQAGNSNTIGVLNTANGYQSLFSNTTGRENTANGYQSLYANTTGRDNTANGYQSLYANITGNRNTANGYQSLYSNTTGRDNTANGYQSLYANTTGLFNTASGYRSLLSNTTGTSNTAIGDEALQFNTTGSDNTAIGFQALQNTTTGSENTAIGDNSLQSNTTGSKNTALGYNANVTSDSLINATAIGYNAKVDSSNSLVLGGKGENAVNVGIGTSAPTELLTLAGTSGTDGILFPDSTLQTTAFTGDYLSDADSDTKIQVEESADEDIIRFDVAGVEAMIIDSTGNVGIGTSAPTELLTLAGTSGTDGILFPDSTLQTTAFTGALRDKIADADNDTKIQVEESADEDIIRFDLAGTQEMVIKNGRLGIGEDFSSPQAPLHISGTADGLTSGIKLSAGLVHSLIYLDDGDLIIRKLNQTDQLVLDQYGDVGIGTSSPASKLDVAGNIQLTDDDPEIVFFDAVGSDSTRQSAIRTTMFSDLDSDDADQKLSFHVSDNTSTGMTTVMTLQGDGNVGIGTSSPASKLDVNGTMQATDQISILDGSQQMSLKTDSAGNYVQLDVGGSGHTGDAIYIGDLTDTINEVYMMGRVGIGTDAPAVKLQVGIEGDGTVARANSWSTWSDRRLKREITELTDPLGMLSQINGYYYYWKKTLANQNRQFGVVAQEVKAILPEIVHTDIEGMLSVDYAKLTGLLIEVNQAQQKEIEKLKTEFENQNTEINDLKVENGKMRSDLESRLQALDTLVQKESSLTSSK